MPQFGIELILNAAIRAARTQSLPGLTHLACDKRNRTHLDVYTTTGHRCMLWKPDWARPAAQFLHTVGDRPDQTRRYG